MLLNTKGIVLKQTKFKESDKILTIFTETEGKITAIAKGARRNKSPLISSTQPFCYSDFILYKGKSMYHVNSGDVKTSFYSMREDLHRFAYATYMVELINSSINYEEESKKIFSLLLKSLFVCSSLNNDFLKFILAFQLKLVSFIGYKPSLNHCINCNSKELEGNIKFSISQGGVLCSKCSSNDRYAKKVNVITLNAMNKLLYTRLDELDKVNVPKNLLLMVEAVLNDYMLNHLEKKYFKSLEFIKSIEI
ncbi:DNA repair protein RecO [Dethiothermospora halolimnae]|uniref:DNA repair protein RecO n=1 Tax=Dethiothermospora halolimnae TaxID=3114390 RepID=UPI003CCBBB55